VGPLVNILLTGGGTGGHVYPALALAQALRREDPACRILFVGSRAGMEASLVPAAGVAFLGLAIRPPRGRAAGRIAVTLASGVVACAQAAAVVARFRPDAVVATGGIAAAPSVVAAAALHVPIVVLEGNVLPGRVNRMLARLSRTVAVASDAAGASLPSRRVVVTGLPVRREIYTASREDGLRLFGLLPGRRTVLVLGGSQGAARLNQAVEDAVARLAGREDLQILHQVGRGWAAATGASKMRAIGSPAGPAGGSPTGSARDSAAGPAGGSLHYVRVPYLVEIGPAYACADLVVSRCGANALAELTACGRPAILVPYPHAAEDHQARNAGPLVSAGAATLIPDPALSGEVLAREIGLALDVPGRLEEMAARMRAFGRPDAAERLAALVVGICRRPAAAQEVLG